MEFQPPKWECIWKLWEFLTYTLTHLSLTLKTCMNHAMPCLYLILNLSLLFCFKLNCKLKAKVTTLSLTRKRGQCSHWHLNFFCTIPFEKTMFQSSIFLYYFKSICNCFIHGYHSPTNNITLGPTMLTCSKTTITIYLILHILRWQFNLMLNF